MNQEKQNWYVESSLALRLGISRDSLHELRRDFLKKNEWKKIGRQVALSERALAKVLEKLGSENFDCSDCLFQENGAEPNEQQLSVQLKVARVYPNPRLILAKTEDGELVRVSVSNNANFRAGMTIKARTPTGPVQLYRLEGRCPRFPGKW